MTGAYIGIAVGAGAVVAFVIVAVVCVMRRRRAQAHVTPSVAAATTGDAAADESVLTRTASDPFAAVRCDEPADTRQSINEYGAAPAFSCQFCVVAQCLCVRACVDDDYRWTNQLDCCD
jgi:hypothetical protein